MVSHGLIMTSLDATTHALAVVPMQNTRALVKHYMPLKRKGAGSEQGSPRAGRNAKEGQPHLSCLREEIHG